MRYFYRFSFLSLVFFLFLCLLFFTCKFFGPRCPLWKFNPLARLEVKANKSHSLRLVLIILDGVRTQEFFMEKRKKTRLFSRASSQRKRGGRTRKAPLLPFLWGELAKKKNTLILGDKEEGLSCYVNNEYYISLPAYADIFSGIRQKNIKTNHFHSDLECPSIIDRLIDLGMPAKDFALFASWKHIERVVSRDNKKNVYMDTGYKKKVRRKKSSYAHPPWKDSRFDSDLQKDIINYLKKKKNKPRFISVIYNDADEWAHIGSYHRYLRALREQDSYIKKLYRYLESQKEYRRQTLYVITTDHGRGLGENWEKHGPIPGARDIWVLLHTPDNSLIPPEKWAWVKNYLQKDCSHLSVAKMSYWFLSHTMFPNRKIQ